MDFFQIFSELPVVTGDDAFCADGPAVFFGHEEAVEVVGGAAVLFLPGGPAVGGKEDDAASPDDPAGPIVGESHTHQVPGVGSAHAIPGRPAVIGAKDGPLFADRVALVVIPEIDVV